MPSSGKGSPVPRRALHRTRGATLEPDPELVAALIAVSLAMLQGVLSRWRDLGPLTLAASGAALLVALPRPAPLVLALVALAVLLASLGWARGAARGVGRPALDGLVVGGAVAAGAVVASLPPYVPAVVVKAAAVGALALLGALAGALALERPGGGRATVRWVGEIPVRGGPPTAPGTPSG